MSLNTVINIGKRQADLNYIYQSNLDPKNRFIDIEFSKSVWGYFDRNVGISTTAFIANLTQNGGDVTTVTILSVKQIDSETEAEASALTGGEMFARVFIDINTYPTGVEEVNLQLVKDNIYDIQGVKLVGQTGNIKLSPLPYAVMGNDYLWWNVEDAGHTEGIADISIFNKLGEYEPTYEATLGSDADGVFANFNNSALNIPAAGIDFNNFVNDYLFFVIHKYQGNTTTPNDIGDIFDLTGNARILLRYPYSTTDTRWGILNIGNNDNTNLQSISGDLTNNKEVLRVDLQSGRPIELLKDNISKGINGSNYIPFKMVGEGVIGATAPTVRNYLGKLYHIIIIKGNYTIQEISALQTYFETL